jgi:phosphatidylglycerol:prolipoprotein diacylglycerol transferase
MHPVLFRVGDLSIYSYGLMIALGAIVGVAYMAVQGKKQVGLTFDQANMLFLLIFIAAFFGGKVFLFFEDPASYLSHPKNLLTGRGFVFYGSFIFAVPTMLLFFRKHRLSTYEMLDVMAITTCLVHIFGRIGCFLAGCCYGLPTSSFFGVVFSDPFCFAQPHDVPLHPTQLYEAFYIFIVLMFLLWLRNRRQFAGQLFLLYLILYAFGRCVIELFRGDEARGYILKDYLSHSQFIALIIITISVYFYRKWSTRNPLLKKKRA